MENSSEINLIATETNTTASKVEANLQHMSTVTLVILILTGIILGGSTLYLRSVGNRLARTHQDLTDSINSQSEKESLYIGIADRLKKAKLAVDAGGSWVSLLVTVQDIVQAPILKSISVDTSKNIVLTMELPDMETAFGILGSTVSEVTENTIRNPQILSFQLSKAGGVSLVLGFQSVP